MHTFAADDLKELLAKREPPCVSVYMPIHRRKTERRADAILYRNLCREVESLLQRDMPGPASRELLALLEAYDRQEFWEDDHAGDGLCVFAARGFHLAYRLPGQFPQLQVVGATFHTKPLIRYLQGNALSCYLLALTLRRVVLYQGLGDSIQEVPLRGVPASLEEFEASFAGEEREPGRPGGFPRLPRGLAGLKEEDKTDLEKFFRAVAKDLWKNHLRTSALPLLLAAPAQHQALFRRVAQIPTLLEAGITVDPAKFAPEELLVEARRVLEPAIQRRVQKAKEEFGLARSRGQGSEDLAEIARLLVAGRIRVLFVESGRRVWGTLNPKTGEILPGDRSRRVDDVDLLDEVAEGTLVRGGEVFVLKKDDMPSATGIAAILRF